MDPSKTMMMSAAGMKAQSIRMRVISENIANASSVALNANEDPYRRKVISFSNTLDRELGINRVQVDNVTFDKSDFGLRYEPGHPAADENGYIRTPNVNGLLEAMDMKQAQRSYEANLNAIDVTKSIAMRTIDMLK